MSIRRLTNDALAARAGDALRARRLQQNRSQKQMADAIGVSIPTIQALEKGRGTIQLMVAVMRELRILDLMIPLIEPPPISPMQVLLTKKMSRQRASSKSRGKTATPSASTDE